jgi:FkbM family methyltransferase
LKKRESILALIARKFGQKAGKLQGWLFERVLERRGRVYRNGRLVFTMRNYSRTTEKRIRRFETKEPDTLAWIDGFAPGEILMDVGANVGAFTLYAAASGIRVVAQEPDALNFALLNLNIMDNGFSDLACAYPYAMHTQAKVAELHMGHCDWGSAHKSFERQRDWQGRTMQVSFVQGSAGMSVDEFLRQKQLQVTRLKIDVDGNEIFVLQGARDTLCGPNLKSILIELSPDHAEYGHCLALLESCGWRLTQRADSSRASTAERFVAVNHIFVRGDQTTYVP